jgi:hypothetical protein
VGVELLHLRIAKMKIRFVSTTVKSTQPENHSWINAIHVLAMQMAVSLAQKWLVQDVRPYYVRKALPASLRMVFLPVNLIILVHFWIAVMVKCVM